MSETLVPGWPQLWQSLLWTNEVALAKCRRLSTCFWVVGTIAKQRGKVQTLGVMLVASAKQTRPAERAGNDS